MRLRRFLLVLGSLVAGGVPGPHTARACEPVLDQSGLVPGFGAANVPRETIITFAQHQAERASAVVTRTRATLPLQPATLGGLLLVTAFRPVDPLPPNEEIELSDGRKFTTGPDLKTQPGPWRLQGSHVHRESDGPLGCGTSSCAGLTTLQIDVTGGTPGQPALFHLVKADDRSDPPHPAVAFFESRTVVDGANRLFLNGSMHLGEGDRFFLVPVSPDGTMGERLGPVHFSDSGGCAIGSGMGGAGALPLVGLLTVLFTLWRRRSGLRGQ